MDIIDHAKKRYATKAFDPTKKIAPEIAGKLKSLLQLAPSSVNSQPWSFIMASSEAGKARVAKGAEGNFVYNREKIMNASHVVVFASRLAMDQDYLDALLALEEAAGRFPNDEAKAMGSQIRGGYVALHRDKLKDVEAWCEKQLYLNLGAFLLGAAALGLDAVPMEGVDMAALDAEFADELSGYRVQVVVALGTASAGDFNAGLPKARRPLEEIITEI